MRRFTLILTVLVVACGGNDDSGNLYLPDVSRADSAVSSDVAPTLDVSPGSDATSVGLDTVVAGDCSAGCTTPPNPCLASPGQCVNNQCVYSAAADQTGCDDGDPCTKGDRCLAGICAGQFLCTASCVSTEALSYFKLIALESEFSGSHPILKWKSDMRLKVAGTPTDADLQTLDRVVAELNALIGGAVTVSTVDSNENATIHFVPVSQFSAIVADYVPGNLGFFYLWWDGSRTITSATILISTTGVTQAERSHLIREELTQSFGLINDGTQYLDSIFQQSWTTTQVYSALDERLIQMLYCSEIEPGMSGSDVDAVFAP